MLQVVQKAARLGLQQAERQDRATWLPGLGGGVAFELGQAKEGEGHARERAHVCRSGYVMRRLGTWGQGVCRAKEWERVCR